MNYCFNKEAISLLLSHKVDKLKIEEEELLSIIELSEGWNCSIFLVNYLLSKIIERRIINGSLSKTLLDDIYSLNNGMNIHIHEFDSDFVDFLLTQPRPSINGTLEEALLSVLEDYIYNKYGSSICY